MSKKLIFLPVLFLALLMLFSCANPMTKLEVDQAKSITQNVTDANGATITTNEDKTNDTTNAATNITDTLTTTENTTTSVINNAEGIDVKAINKAFAKTRNNLKERCNPNAENPNYQAILQMYQSFATGDVAGFLNCLSDNIVWIHQGPQNENFPYYGKFEGKQGVLMWLYFLTSKANMEGFDFRYIVTDGNRVNGHVLEHAYMKDAGTYALVENFHSFLFNKEGKIEYAVVISESATAYLCETEKNPSIIYQPKYPLPVYDINKYFNRNHYENMVEKIIKFYSKDKNRDKQIMKYFADDAVFIATGYEGVLPFAGKYVGKQAINNIFETIANQNIHYNITAIVTERNKANILFDEKAFVPSTGKSFACAGALALQFDEQGKIRVLYYYHDSYSASAAYMK